MNDVAKIAKFDRAKVAEHRYRQRRNLLQHRGGGSHRAESLSCVVEEVEHHLRAPARGNVDENAHDFERSPVRHRADDLHDDGVHRTGDVKRQIGGVLLGHLAHSAEMVVQSGCVRFGDEAKQRLLD